MKTYEIHDFLGNPVTVAPKLELYTVADFMGTEMHGIAIQLYTVVSAENPELAEPYATLTVSFGEFIGMKNVAYIDTNNCLFASELLKYGFAQDTGFTKDSGFCTYPLWGFEEDFLKEIGAENYKKYSDEFDAYMKSFCCEQEKDENEIFNLQKGDPVYVVAMSWACDCESGEDVLLVTSSKDKAIETMNEKIAKEKADSWISSVDENSVGDDEDSEYCEDVSETSWSFYLNGSYDSQHTDVRVIEIPFEVRVN